MGTESRALTRNRPFIIFNCVLNVVCLLIFAYVIYFLYRPTPVARALVRTFDVRPEREDWEHVRVEEFRDEITKTTESIYYFSKPDNETGDLLIVDIPGGAFIVSSSSLAPYKAMRGLKHDVVSIKYPVLFKAKAKTAIEYLERAIAHVIEEYRTRWNSDSFKICLLGASAGSYYAVKIINRGKFNDRITKFISICGYFGYTCTSNVVLRTLDRLYLTSLFQDKTYLCEMIPATVSTMFVTGTHDFLGECTKLFAEKNQQEPHVYEGDHLFFWSPGLESAQKLYGDIESFLDE